MADIITNGTLLDYNVNLHNTLEDGTLPSYPDPAAPTATGPLTAAEIAILRQIINEVANRFNTGGGGAA